MNKFITTNKTKRIFVNPAAISKHLYCSICRDVYSDPVRLQCGHVFCYICIQSWAFIKLSCPLCKTSFGSRKPEVDLLAMAFLDELEVKCAHQNCQWQGVEAMRSKHQRQCTFRPKNEDSLPTSTKQVIEVTDAGDNVIDITDDLKV